MKNILKIALAVTLILSPSILFASEPARECAICLETYPSNDTITLPCSPDERYQHSFHVYCIAGWLKSNPTCPLCCATADAETLTYLNERITYELIDALCHNDLNKINLCLDKAQYNDFTTLHTLPISPGEEEERLSILMLAATLSSTAIVEKLIATAGPARLNSQNPHRKTAITYAIQAGKLRNIEALMRAGATITDAEKIKLEKLQILEIVRCMVTVAIIIVVVGVGLKVYNAL